MYPGNIGSEIRDFVIANFLYGKANGFTDGESMLDNGVIDSTGVLELISFLQERFEIEVQDDEIIPANLDSINNLVHYVCRKTGTLA